MKDGVDILLRDDPDSFAEAVSDLLLNPTSAHLLACRAESKVRKHHGWASVSDDFAENCEWAIEQHRSGHRPGVDAARDLKLPTENSGKQNPGAGLI